DLARADARAADARPRGRPRGPGQDPRADRVGRQLPEGQGDPRAEGHEGEPGRRGVLPEDRRGEDLAAVPAAVRGDVGQDRQHALRPGSAAQKEREQWPTSDSSVSETWVTRWRTTC